MTLVDTNVLSEPLRAQGDPRVVAWLDRQAAETLFISTISVSEILFGLAALLTGKPRSRLVDAFESAIERLFDGRILSFDLAAALVYPTLMSATRARGSSIALADGQIAAIAAGNRLTVATRDESPFRAVGVKTVNPWME